MNHWVVSGSVTQMGLSRGKVNTVPVVSNNYNTINDKVKLGLQLVMQTNAPQSNLNYRKFVGKN